DRAHDPLMIVTSVGKKERPTLRERRRPTTICRCSLFASIATGSRCAAALTRQSQGRGGRPICHRGVRVPQILVNDDDVLIRPAQRHRALAQGVLARGAFAVLQDLLPCTLTHVETGHTTQLLCRNRVSHVSSPRPPAEPR